MAFLRTFFEQNQPIIQFLYGLSFFAMGLAIALQSRSSSRLELARSLAWLSAFGLANSLYIWAELFSPVQEAYLSPGGIEVLHGIHLIILSISYACLFEFGVALLRPLNRGQWLHWVSIIWLAIYWGIILVGLPSRQSNPISWHNTAEALARYTIGFPGGLLAAYGLREQTFRHIAPLKAPHIVAMLRTAGITLALYALVGGLVPPPVAFFPGNVINTETYTEVVGAPPLVLLALIGLVLVITIIRALEIFQMETNRRIEDMEQQQILAAERDRLARDLHDGNIQTAYTAALLVDSARKLAPPESPIASRLEKAVAVLNDVILDLRRNLGELRVHPEIGSLASALERLANDPRYRSLIQISLSLDLPEGEVLSPTSANHVLSIVQESLSNVIRHARARNVWIRAAAEDGRLRLVVHDDGIGIGKNIDGGYGLRNMRERARLLNGDLQVDGEHGRGTTVTLDAPLEEILTE